MRNDQTGVLVVCFLLGYFSDSGGAVRISECSQAGWMEIGEDGQSENITCVDIPANETVRWQVFTGTANTGSASCGPLRNCTHSGADLAVSRPSDTSSVLTIVDNLRIKVGNGSVSCTAVNLQPNEFISCKINVVTPAPPLSPCNLEVNVTDWTVAGTCRFEHAFSSNGTYTCTWRQHHNQSVPDKTMAGTVDETEQRLSNKTYYSGTCSFTSLLATRVSEGDYSYSVQFYPGSGTATVGTLRVDRPGQPRTNCSQYVYEGQDVLCHCLPNASTPGSPPPALQWQGHSAGSPLGLRDVRRDRSGHVFVCTLLWGPPSDRVAKHVNYTLEVALVTWTGVQCSSAPNSTGETDDNVCRFRPAQEDDGKVVTCVASNSVFPDHLVRNATYEIELRDEEDRNLPIGAIAGGAAAAAAVVVVVVVVVVIVVRRKRRKQPTDAGKEEDADTKDDAEEHINPLYGTGASLDTPPQPRPKPAGLALRIPSSTNSADLDYPAQAGESPALREGGHNQGDDLGDDEADIGYTGVSFSGQQTTTSATPATRKARVVNPSSHGAAASRGASSASAGPGSRGHDPAAARDVNPYESADGDSPGSSGRLPGSSGRVPGSSCGPQNVAQDFFAYANVDDANGQTAAPQRDTYAVVNKSGPRATPRSTVDGAGSADDGSGVDDSYAYAVVNKDRSGRNAGIASTRPAPRAGEDIGGQAEPSRDVYAQVDKSAKRSNSRPSAPATAEPETEAYAQVQKPKPGVKPKPKPKPKSALRPNSPDAAGPPSRDNGYDDISPHASGGLQEGMTQNTSGDVYNTLSYSKQASLPEPADPDPQYSHIGHV